MVGYIGKFQEKRSIRIENNNSEQRKMVDELNAAKYYYKDKNIYIMKSF